MKLNRKKTLGILLFIFLIGAGIAIATDPGKAMHSPSRTLILDQVYVPAIYKNSTPVNPFGITLNSFREAGGLTQEVEASASWSRRDITWSSIEATDLLDVSPLFIEFER